MALRENIAPSLLIVLGVLIGMGFYEFDTFQLNAFNIGAFFFTISCVNQGSVTSKVNDVTIKSFRKLNISIGIIMLITAAFAKGFKYYNLIEGCINSIDTNALLLIGIAITLWSFKISDIYNNNALLKEKKKTDANYHKLIKEQKEKLKYQEANLKCREENQGLKKRNNELAEHLEEATKIVGKLQEELEKRKNRGE
ncbi:hypothetical protein [Bacillus toyonensis]|uniref:hypothetical protein n=1 Tax=Bacillus toyonensis TaxID=155322 RepID=UPI000BEF8F1E|nr:hypothetical protein [Bacillus toyonensis]PEJ99867.1 hypothetical protein CN688_03440 [Bacillus toyonensis]